MRRISTGQFERSGDAIRSNVPLFHRSLGLETVLFQVTGCPSLSKHPGLPPVEVPLANVDQEGVAVDQSSAEFARISHRLLALDAPAIDQFSDEPGGDIRLVGRIDETVEVDVKHQQLPTPIESSQQVSPIDRAMAGIDQVQDVGAVETLAVGHVGLDPDQILDRTHAHRFSKNGGRLTAFVPLAVDWRAPASEAEDEVDIIESAVRVGKPVRCRYLDHVAVGGEGGER